MADNLGYTEGSGKIVRSTEDGDNAHHQHLVAEGFDADNTQTLQLMQLDSNLNVKTVVNNLPIDGNGNVMTADQQLAYDGDGNLKVNAQKAYLHAYYNDPFDPLWRPVYMSGSRVMVEVQDDLVLGSSSNSLGKVKSHQGVCNIEPTLDTSAYADGDVLFTNEQLYIALDAYEAVVLESLVVIDKDNQGGAFDILFFDNGSIATFGSVNAAVQLTDEEAVTFLGKISIAAGDYIEIPSKSKLATKTNIGLMLVCNGNNGLRVCAISRDTKTYTASGLLIRVGYRV